MVVPSLGGSRIIRVVRIIVVGAVLKVRRIQSLHTQWSAQVLVCESQRTKSVPWVKQLWCHDHCDREIWPKLIVGPLPSGARTVHILVNPSTIDKPSGDLVFGIFRRICETPSVRLQPKEARQGEVPNGT